MSLCLKSCISVHFPHQSSWSTQCDQSCCKTSLNHNFSSTVLDSWYKVCVLICYVWVLQMYHFVVWPNNLYCGLVSPKDSRSLVDCTDATVQTPVILLCSFQRDEAFSWCFFQTSRTCSGPLRARSWHCVNTRRNNPE